MFVEHVDGGGDDGGGLEAGVDLDETVYRSLILFMLFTDWFLLDYPTRNGRGWFVTSGSVGEEVIVCCLFVCLLLLCVEELSKIRSGGDVIDLYVSSIWSCLYRLD